MNNMVSFSAARYPGVSSTKPNRSYSILAWQYGQKMKGWLDPILSKSFKGENFKCGDKKYSRHVIGYYLMFILFMENIRFSRKCWTHNFIQHLHRIYIPCWNLINIKLIPMAMTHVCGRYDAYIWSIVTRDWYLKEKKRKSYDLHWHQYSLSKDRHLRVKFVMSSTAIFWNFCFEPFNFKLTPCTALKYKPI